jgi:putative phosphoribosyl transferase
VTGFSGAATLKVSVRSDIGAVVSREGRPDLAEEVLAQVKSPTLLFVGDNDDVVLQVNRSEVL